MRRLVLKVLVWLFKLLDEDIETRPMGGGKDGPRHLSDDSWVALPVVGVNDGPVYVLQATTYGYLLQRSPGPSPDDEADEAILINHHGGSMVKGKPFAREVAKLYFSVMLEGGRHVGVPHPSVDSSRPNQEEKSNES